MIDFKIKIVLMYRTAVLFPEKDDRGDENTCDLGNTAQQTGSPVTLGIRGALMADDRNKHSL